MTKTYHSAPIRITWVDAPPPAHVRKTIKKLSKWQQVVKTLSENPGKWALISRNAQLAMVTRLKKVDSHIEATGRVHEGDRGEIYARWNP